MRRVRVIPLLLLSGTGLVKTVQFRNPTYLGDPRNAVRIFNDKEVDELAILDILATTENRPVQLDLIREIVSEAFMPVAYGGGIRTIDDAEAILSAGVEKLILCTSAGENCELVRQLASYVGSQSIVVCIDVRRRPFGRYEMCTRGGRKGSKLDPVTFARKMEAHGAGELIVNSIDQDGTMAGYDLEVLKLVTSAVRVPVIASGGAGSLEDLRRAVEIGGAAAVAAGSLFVFHGKHRAVLINYPDQNALKRVFTT